MKISETTLKILKNFSSFSNSLVINEIREIDGKMQATNKIVGGLGTHSPIYGFYDLRDEEKNLPEIPIYDLSRFLAIMFEITKHKEWEIIFEESLMKIRTSNSEVKYYYSEKDAFAARPKAVRLDDGYIMKFILKKENLKDMFMMSSILGCSSIIIESKKGKLTKDGEECYVIMGTIKDIGNSLSNSYKDIWGKNQKEFQGNVVFNSTSFKMITEYDYETYVYNDRVVLNALCEVKGTDGKIEFKPLGLMYLIPATSQK